MGRKKLFKREEVLSAIHRWIFQHGAPPTVEELRQALGAGSTRTVSRYLGWLEEQGDIKRWSGARGIQLLRAPDAGPTTVSVPVVGIVPAGPAMLVEENIEGHVRLSKELAGSRLGKFFLLRVQGDSMNKARVRSERIEDGDLVLVRQQSVADPSNIVVILIDGEATIKRLVKGPNFWFLRPESTSRRHQPVVLQEDAAIQGVVRAVIKKGAILLQ